MDVFIDELESYGMDLVRKHDCNFVNIQPHWYFQHEKNLFLGVSSA